MYAGQEYVPLHSDIAATSKHVGYGFVSRFIIIHGHFSCCFALYGFKIPCKISKGPFEIKKTMLDPYTSKYAYYCILFLCVIYDFFELWRI